MLKKNERLTKKQFDRFFSSGKRVHSPAFTLLYTPEETFHGAVVVGKKVYKKAVDRNHLRRRLYNALYKEVKDTEATGVFIILTKSEAIGLDFKELRQSIGSVLKTVLK
jgi:ribonuclease P protein component